MSFSGGFAKTALTEHEIAGLLALPSGGESAMYTAMKSKEKDKPKAYLKHRFEITKGFGKGTALGGLVGLALGHVATKGHFRGVHKRNMRYQDKLGLPKHPRISHLGATPTVKLPGITEPVSYRLLGSMIGGGVGGAVGKYHGAKRGYEKVTGKKER